MSISGVILFTLFSAVFARPEYRGRLPNESVQGLCAQLGHTGCTPGNTTINQLALDFRAAGYQYTKEFCEKDSDGDGVTNGAELGDPCCVWTTGSTPARTTDITSPSDANSKPAPNTVITCQTGGGGAQTPAQSPSGGPSSETAPSTPSPTPVCFPADAEVTLDTGVVKTMDQLNIGDRVAVAAGKFSAVFMFTHRVSSGSHEMVALTTESGASITLTAGHHLYVSDQLVRADSVALGDLLKLVDGTMSKVVEVRAVSKRGLYNPQTSHGDIAVGGIVASTYTDAIMSCVAHAALSPLRALYAWLGLHSAVLEGGVERYISA